MHILPMQEQEERCAILDAELSTTSCSNSEAEEPGSIISLYTIPPTDCTGFFGDKTQSFVSKSNLKAESFFTKSLFENLECHKDHSNCIAITQQNPEDKVEALLAATNGPAMDKMDGMERERRWQGGL